MTAFTPPLMEISEFEGRFVLLGILHTEEAAEQIAYFRREKNFKVEHQQPYGGGVLILSLIEDKAALQKLYEIYEPLTRGYRGTYQAFAKGIVAAYHRLPDPKKA